MNPAINAVVDPLPELALEAADAADAAQARGRRARPAAWRADHREGECRPWRAAPTTNGVVAFRDADRPEDSAVVGNLRRAGAIVIGRTNTPAFSLALVHRQRHCTAGR